MKVFSIAPGGSSAFAFFIGLGLLMLAIAVLFFVFANASRNLRFEMSAAGLAIKGDIYGRTIPYDQLVMSEAEILDLRDSEFRMKWKRNGSALPNFKTGWFTLRNGRKALVFVTDMTRVIRVPTSDGYELLVSPKEPEAFLDALKESTGFRG